jgi:hypothetical protein
MRKITIKLMIGDIEVTEEEAREIYVKLKDLFEPQTTVTIKQVLPCDPYRPYIWYRNGADSCGIDGEIDY